MALNERSGLALPQ